MLLFALFSSFATFIAIEVFLEGILEDHVWFEDRWMVASCCDE
jgi:hypothetical protein